MPVLPDVHILNGRNIFWLDIYGKLLWIYLIFHLLKELLLAIRSIADEVDIFQQACRARQTVEPLCREKLIHCSWQCSRPTARTLDRLITAFEVFLESDARTTLSHAIAVAGRGNSAAEGDEHLRWWAPRLASSWVYRRSNETRCLCLCTRRSLWTVALTQLVACFMSALNVLSQWQIISDIVVLL